ncbi:MAG: FliM/FliN family flagellar motor C-terminal domain-containing protein [Planctomycetota bacterium]
MSAELHAQFVDSLRGRGEALAIGMGFTLGEYLGTDDLQVAVAGAPMTDPGKVPQGLPTHGLLLTHEGVLTAPRNDPFALGWLFDDKLEKLVSDTAGESMLAEKIDALAQELADVLATDKFNIQQSSGLPSEDLFHDYLAGNLPPKILWLHFQVSGIPDGPANLWLAHPLCVVERMFGPNQGIFPGSTYFTQPAVPETPVSATTEKPMQRQDEAVPVTRPATTVSFAQENIRRLLRTPVPIIVTLAEKRLSTDKLIEIGPGSIIEFERPCDEPLQLSVNNLPIGQGEAVKIGDHFGLKVTSILPAEERVARLAGKSRF